MSIKNEKYMERRSGLDTQFTCGDAARLCAHLHGAHHTHQQSHRSTWVTVWMLVLCRFGLCIDLDNLTSVVVMLMALNLLTVNHRQRVLPGAIIA